MTDWMQALKQKLETKTARVSVVGMGYVGLSLAVELAKSGLTVRGVDLDLERVSLLNRGESYLVDVSSDTLGPLVAAVITAVILGRSELKAWWRQLLNFRASVGWAQAAPGLGKRRRESARSTTTAASA